VNYCCIAAEAAYVAAAVAVAVVVVAADGHVAAVHVAHGS